MSLCIREFCSHMKHRHVTSHNHVLLKKSLLKVRLRFNLRIVNVSYFIEQIMFVTSADGKWQNAVEQVFKNIAN